MKRFHVHVAVNDLEASVRFYSSMFASSPTVHKPDYAKWMLDDPRINFAISQRGLAPGVDHLGFQVDSDEALGELIEFDNTNTIFIKPKNKQTEDYITGRFG